MSIYNNARSGSVRGGDLELVGDAARSVRDPLTAVLGFSSHLGMLVARGDERPLLDAIEPIGALQWSAARLRLSFESLLALLEAQQDAALELTEFDLVSLAREEVAEGLHRGLPPISVGRDGRPVTVRSDARIARLLIGQLIELAASAQPEIRARATGCGDSLLILFRDGGLSAEGNGAELGREGSLPRRIIGALAVRLGAHIAYQDDAPPEIVVTFPGEP